MANLKQLTVLQLWQTYNAIMAGAYPGDENTVLDELKARGEIH
jgi:hypothetical protein